MTVKVISALSAIAHPLQMGDVLRYTHCSVYANSLPGVSADGQEYDQ